MVDWKSCGAPTSGGDDDDDEDFWSRLVMKYDDYG